MMLRIMQLAPYYDIQSGSADPRPIAVAGQFSKFTLLVLTYSERLPLLHTFISHYSQCASVRQVAASQSTAAQLAARSFLCCCVPPCDMFAVLAAVSVVMCLQMGVVLLAQVMEILVVWNRGPVGTAYDLLRQGCAY